MADSTPHPLVSIITATYNRGNVLRYAIESVRRQTLTDWEMWVVGDACTDVHQYTTDRLFVSHGLLRIVLYDAREGSPTYRQVSEHRFGALRPALLVVPPGVWHGVQNISSEPALLINLVDRAYCYEDPDHWRLPQDTEKIPYRFAP